MGSKDSRFILGVLGLRVYSLDVAFTVATVRNRPHEIRMDVPTRSSAEVVITSFRVIGYFVIFKCLLYYIENRFAWQVQYFCDIFIKYYIFRNRYNTLDVFIVIFRGRRCTLDVLYCIFFGNRIGTVVLIDNKIISHETLILKLQIFRC